jgi:hypothetical protein
LLRCKTHIAFGGVAQRGRHQAAITKDRMSGMKRPDIRMRKLGFNKQSPDSFAAIPR